MSEPSTPEVRLVVGGVPRHFSGWVLAGFLSKGATDVLADHVADLGGKPFDMCAEMVRLRLSLARLEVGENEDGE